MRRARLVGVGLAVAVAAACGDAGEPSGTGAGGTAGSGGADATAGGAGGSPSTTSVGAGGAGAGGVGGDLGWPFPDDLPSRCPPLADDGGTAWDGWANLQFPAALTGTVGATTDPVYGRVYRAGDTDAPGQAPGWEAELGLGPRGTVPTGEGRCWSFEPASFNVDVANDDEYQAALSPTTQGLYSLFYRYRPPGGAWRYGDLDGSDDGIEAEEGASLVVTGGPSGDRFVVVTLNLRCRLDDWPARSPLVVEALARVDPDLIAFQEDCVDAGGPSQAQEIRAALATYTGRGYALRRAVTHQAESGNTSYEEGVSLLSAWPIEDTRVLDLPFAQIPRKAIAVDVNVGSALRFYATHFDFGAAGEGARAEAAQVIVDDLPGGLAVVAGDLNADPAEPAITTLGAALTDLWSAANPSQLGLTFPSDGPTTRIDYVFGSPSSALGAKLLDASSGGTWLSDHLGVAVAIDVP